MKSFKYVLAGVACALVLAPLAAEAGPLRIVDVNAPAVNCVFNPTCTVTVTDSVGPIMIPGVTGTARLQSRTYVGAPGTPAAGLTAYEYRVDLTQARSAVGAAARCVSKLILDFGPVTALSYRHAPPSRGSRPPPPPYRLADVFVVTTGGLGTIGLASANQVGNIITFTFSTPVCPGVPAAMAVVPGKTSFFFGLAATTAPMPKPAHVTFNLGGGTVTASRVPRH